MSDDEVDYALAWLVSSEEPAKCIRSITVLGRSRNARAVLPLFNLMVQHPENVELENSITLALANFGELAVSPLIAALQEGNEHARRKAAHVLGRLGDAQALTPFAQALQDADVGVRVSVVTAAGKFHPQQALLLLLAALHDASAIVRSTAAAELFNPKYRDERTSTALMEAMQDPNAEVRSNVIRALGKHGESRAVPSLLEAARDEAQWVRAAAAEALGRLHETRAIPLHIRAIHDESAFVREGAALALAGFGDRKALVIALLTCEHLTPSDKLNALETLIRLQFKGIDITLDFRFPAVAPYCRSLLQEDSPLDIKKAVAAIEEEIQARRDQRQLLRGSQSDLLNAKEELLRAHSGVGSSPPEEMLRASDAVPPSDPTPPSSWLARLQARRKQRSP